MKLNLIILLCLISTSLFSQKKFKPGYYYDNSNEKTNCIIKVKPGGSSLLAVRPTSIIIKKPESKKKIKLKIDDISSFVVEQDSFAKIKNIPAHTGMDLPFKVDFAKIVEEGKINLYSHHSMGSTGGQYPTSYDVIRYVAQKNGSDKYILLADRIKKERLLKLIKDNKELYSYVNSIREKKLDDAIILDVIRKYNSN